MSSATTQPRFPIISYEEANGEVKEIYDDILKYYTFVPNWYKTQGMNPQILKGNWEKVKHTLYKGKVPLVLKQMILWSISKANRCQYCETMHYLEVKNLENEISQDPGYQFSFDLLDPALPSTYKTAVRVLTEVAQDPLQTEQSHYSELEEEGFSPEEIQELFAQVGLAIFLNTYADISGVMVDAEALSSN